MPQLKVKTESIGKYRSTTENSYSNSPITVDAMKFTPLDLLSSAYNSCMLGTMEYAANKVILKLEQQIVRLNGD